MKRRLWIACFFPTLGLSQAVPPDFTTIDSKRLISGVSENIYFTRGGVSTVGINAGAQTTGVSNADVYFSIRKNFAAIPIEEYAATISGISGEVLVKFGRPHRTVFVHAETSDVSILLKKPVAPQVVVERIPKTTTMQLQSADTTQPKGGTDSEEKDPPQSNASKEQLAKKTVLAVNDPQNTVQDATPTNVTREDKSTVIDAPPVTLAVAANDVSKNRVVDNPEPPTAVPTGVVNTLKTVPKYHALIIGVSTYRYSGPGLPNLDRPVMDASTLKETLEKYYHFPKENIHFLKDAMRGEIIDELETIGTQLSEKDNLLIFYAGHGFWDENLGIGYWLPSDAMQSKKSTWISNSTIKDYIGGLKTKHTLLITDACFSGSIFKSREVGNLNEAGVQKLYQLPSRKAMTSGNMKTVPDQSKFFEYLNKRLIQNEDTFLSAQQLFHNFYIAVINNTNTVPQYGVIQETGDEGGDFIFIRR